MASSSSHPSNIVIVGAGIIGVSTAYYLSSLASESSLPPAIHLLELSPTLFSSASGNAAGFLARDWHGPATASLGALSFDLHRALAEKHDGARRWGYAASAAFSLASVAGGEERGEDWLFQGTSRALMARGRAGGGDLPAWLAQNNSASVEALSSGDTTAQVNPLQLCQFLLEECTSRGVQLHHPAAATQVHTSADNVLTGVDLPITQLSGHSLLLRSPHWTETSYLANGCAAAFATDTAAGFSPEIFSRVGGDIFLGGLNTTSIPVADVRNPTPPDADAVAQLEAVAKRLLGTDELDVVKAGFCHRPVAGNGTPLLTKLGEKETGLRPDAGGVWLSAGHGPWGISLSLGTGLTLAQMVLGRSADADISYLHL
ncbi:FAD dependent oxidoreductase [Auriscalpium vulgare]|uniref:FAD dependent oxidoreductase n=1 Tax=Auriscalpium vulgare TaxID=40419 RepID=A0ACB8SA70_9AGAM|nr:FAD dependent oxidoreductase [Auriscalpium vulgare]